MSAPTRARSSAVFVTLGVALIVAVIAGVGFGAVSVEPGEIVGSIGRALVGQSSGTRDALVVDLRLPRVALAALVGACLAGAGVLYQALFRNPLADPYILGVSSGAGLGTILVFVLTTEATFIRYAGVPAGAFTGAVLTIWLVARLSSARGSIDTASLLLAGVAISYTLSALTSFIMVFARESMATVVYWMMGGLTGASWQYVVVVVPMFAIGMIVPLTNRRALNLMLLGDERASHLGVDVERLKRRMLLSGSLLVAAAVAVSGLIGFVGLMVPHMVRLVLGPDHRTLVPASVLGGAVVMVLADLVARTILAPIEIPVGIVTALAGGPFFVWLLVREGSRL